MKRPGPSFLDLYDALLVDMDGTLIHGANAIDHAPEAMARARTQGLKVAFATNNASRTAAQVVEHLDNLGFEAHEPEVITSPMVALELVRERVPNGATVLVVGGVGLVSVLESAGYRVVREAGPDVAAVVQGFSPDVGWRDLAQAAYAIAAGAVYVATNVDSTLPTEQGFAPGNGSLVQAVVHATGVVPASAGKPQPAMFEVAAQHAGATQPLVVGDRLDTDLEGGVRAGFATFHTLTGVSSWMDAIHADPIRRPTVVRPNLSYLAGEATPPVISGTTARFGTVTATLDGAGANARIVVSGDTAGWRTPQAVLSLVHSAFPDSAFSGEVVAADAGPLTPLFFR